MERVGIEPATSKLLTERLPDVRVGTVDKFRGTPAPGLQSECEGRRRRATPRGVSLTATSGRWVSGVLVTARPG